MLAHFLKKIVRSHVLDAALPENLCQLVNGHAAFRIADGFGKFNLGGVDGKLLFQGRIFAADDFKGLRKDVLTGEGGWRADEALLTICRKNITTNPFGKGAGFRLVAAEDQSIQAGFGDDE